MIVLYAEPDVSWTRRHWVVSARRGRSETGDVLAVVLACESLAAARPLAHEGAFLGVGAQMTWIEKQDAVPSESAAGQGRLAGIRTSEVEPTRECAAAAGDRAVEVGLVPAAARAGRLRRAGRDLLLLHLQDRWQTRAVRAAKASPPGGGQARLFVENGRLRRAFGLALGAPSGVTA